MKDQAHYSYRVYADPATAASFDRRRFGGPIGEMVAGDQARAIEEFVPSPAGRTVLDVGTGTGRAALLMARRGARVTGVDASADMLNVARQRAAEDRVDVAFQVGDIHRLAFPDRAFDVVISLRVLMHTPDWRQSLAELCRVARATVIVDYPSATSVALVESMARRITDAFGARTEPYRVFTDAAVARELGRRGFRIRAVHRQFVLPIALHKAIGSARFSRVTRSISGRLGLLRLFGSPVTLVAERCES